MSAETLVPIYTNASLYVGDLDPYVNESMLHEKFAVCGAVSLVRICRDKVTKQSLGYAYVNFYQASDAERALDTLNYELLNGKPMRLMWCQRDPGLRKSGVGNVFIKNLDQSIDNKALYDTFSEFGNIISCKIMLDENSRSKGYGFVHFVSEESAEKAIAAAHEKLIMGKKVFVGKFISKMIRAAEVAEHVKKFKNIYVKNFDQDLDDDSLRELFTNFGNITSAKVEKKPTGESAGFGFVEFAESESALKAVQEMNEYELNGKKLLVTKFEKKAERLLNLKKLYEERKQELLKKYAKSNVFVKNLDEIIDDKRLYAEFAKYGQIKSAKVMLDEQNNSKGFGFVCFSQAEEATRAIEDMNGRMLGSKPLYVTLAQRKEDRRKLLAAKLKERYQANQYLIGNQAYAMSFPNQYQNFAASVPRWQQNKIMSAQQHHQQQQVKFYQASQQQQQQQQQQQNYFANPRMAQSRFNSAPRPLNNTNFYHHQQQQQQPPQMPRYQYNQLQAFQAQQPHIEQNSFLTQLAAMNPQNQKNFIGEHLFVRIQSMSNENPGKITGMFLEGIDTSELILMLENEQLLLAKIREAEQLLKTHQTNKGSMLQGPYQQNQIENV